MLPGSTSADEIRRRASATSRCPPRQRLFAWQMAMEDEPARCCRLVMTAGGAGADSARGRTAPGRGRRGRRGAWGTGPLRAGGLAEVLSPEPIVADVDDTVSVQVGHIAAVR